METKMWQVISTGRVSKNSKIILISILLILSIFLFVNLNKEAQLLSKSEASSLLEKNAPQNILIKAPYLYFELNNQHYKIAKEAYSQEEIFSLGKIEYYEDKSSMVDTLLMLLLLVTMFYLIFAARKAQKKQTEMMLKKVTQTEIPPQEANGYIKAQQALVNFSDVAGMHGVKEELQEVIDFLKHPEKYKAFDISLPKGVLLVGPPGVGKTLIAKAVAGEANVPFFYQSAASFVQIYVGMGAKRVAELFAKAKEMAPSIIFIDEIDAVGKSRGGQNNEEREATLNQLLTEMDGFEESTGVMVIAATNKIEVLDDALLRAGRFDRRIHIGLPDFLERSETLKLYLKGKKHRLNIDNIARLTIGFNSAALSTLVNEAALYALRLNKSFIEEEAIEAVREKVLLGKFKIKNFSEEERSIQALYQAAKAITAAWLELEFEKIGILSSQFVPRHHEIVSKTFLENELKVLLAGKIATQKHYGELFSNAKEDIKVAKALSFQIVEEFFMIENHLSVATQSQEILTRANDEVVTLLSKLQRVLTKVQAYLLENESISMTQTKKIIDEMF